MFTVVNFGIHIVKKTAYAQSKQYNDYHKRVERHALMEKLAPQRQYSSYTLYAFENSCFVYLGNRPLDPTPSRWPQERLCKRPLLISYYPTPTERLQGVITTDREYKHFMHLLKQGTLWLCNPIQ
jgi:hypothetical protein